MRWLLRFSVSHPWFILAAVGVLTAAACLFIPRVRLQLDARSLIPLGDPQLAASDNAARLFGLRDAILVGVASDDSDIYSPDTLARIARVSDGLSRIPGVIAPSVKSLSTVPRLFIANGKIETQSLLAQTRLPGAETAYRIRHETERMGLNNGVLVAKDGKAATVYAEVEPGADRYAIHDKAQELLAREAPGSLAQLSGTALAQAALGESAARDLARLVPIVIVVLGGALIFAFRGLIPAMISLAEIGVSLLWTAGLIGLTGQPVYVTTLVAPVILIAVGVSDDVYALSHFFNVVKQGADQETAEVTLIAFNKVVRPISLTAVSTVVGLLSMAATNLQPLRVFGLFGSVAILFSTLFTFTLVPALLTLMRPRAPLKIAAGRAPGSERLMAAFRALIGLSPYRILAVGLLAALCAGLLATRVRVDDSWIRNLPEASDIFQGDKTLNNLLAGTTTLELMIDSGSRDGFLQPQNLAILGALEDALTAVHFVGAASSVYSDVVRLNASLRGLSYSEYRNSLRQQGREMIQAEIEQAILLMSSTKRAALNEKLDNAYQRARLTVFIKSAAYERIDEILRRAYATIPILSSSGGAMTPFGDGWISYLTVRLLVRGQVYAIALALLTDLVLLSLLLKSARMGLIAILPVVFSLLVVFAVLGAIGIPLGIANSMFVGIAIGIGLDFSIHLTTAYRQGLLLGLEPRDSLTRAFEITGPAIATSAVAIAAGFSVLSLSEVAPNMQLGLLICLSLIVCAAATLIFTPALVTARISAKLRLRPSHVKGPVIVLLLSLPALGCGSKPTSTDQSPPATSDARVLPEPETAIAEDIPDGARPDVSGLIRAYNSRNFGSPGWRSVSMELVTDGKVTRAFMVRNLWVSMGEEVKTLFLLEQPKGLSGTSYLLVEKGGEAPSDMSVHLFLPSSEGGALEVAHSEFDEGLLGSDFTYTDLRMRLPTQGHIYGVTGQATLLNEPVWVVEARPSTQTTRETCSWDIARFYMAKNYNFLLGADYYNLDAGAKAPANPAKRMRVERLNQINGVLTATQITMFVEKRRGSVLTLKDAGFKLDGLDPGLFSPDRLPMIAEKARQGLASELVKGVEK